jgi:hypothetical protein
MRHGPGHAYALDFRLVLTSVHLARNLASPLGNALGSTNGSSNRIARANGALVNLGISVKTVVPADRLGLVTVFTGATFVI